MLTPLSPKERAKAGATASLVLQEAHSLFGCGQATPEAQEALCEAVAQYFAACAEARVARMEGRLPLAEYEDVDPESAAFWRCNYHDAEAEIAGLRHRHRQLADALFLANDLLTDFSRRLTAPKRPARYLTRAAFMERLSQRWLTPADREEVDRFEELYSGITPDGEPVPDLQSGPMLRSIWTLVEEARVGCGAAVLSFHPWDDSERPEAEAEEEEWARMLDEDKQPAAVVVVAGIGKEAELLSRLYSVTPEERNVAYREEWL